MTEREDSKWEGEEQNNSAKAMPPDRSLLRRILKRAEDRMNCNIELVKYVDCGSLDQMADNLKKIKFGMPVRRHDSYRVYYYLMGDSESRQLLVCDEDPFAYVHSKGLLIKGGDLENYRLLLPVAQVINVSRVRNAVKNICFSDPLLKKERIASLVEGQEVANPWDILSLDENFEQIFFNESIYYYGGYWRQHFLLFENLENALKQEIPDEMVSIFTPQKIKRVNINFS